MAFGGNLFTTSYLKTPSRVAGRFDGDTSSAFGTDVVVLETPHVGPFLPS